jgi:uncharacterized protein (TIGR02284 family)
MPERAWECRLPAWCSNRFFNKDSDTMPQHDTISTLNTLIETCKDGEYGFRTSAEHLRDPDIQRLFMQRADECRRSADELQAMVRELGGSAEDSGSAAGAMHRGWVAMKDKLTGSSDRAILEETERGEDIALKHYRKALEAELPPQVRNLVERQYAGVERNHAQVRALRDQARQATA